MLTQLELLGISRVFYYKYYLSYLISRFICSLRGSLLGRKPNRNLPPELQESAVRHPQSFGFEPVGAYYSHGFICNCDTSSQRRRSGLCATVTLVHSVAVVYMQL